MVKPPDPRPEDVPVGHAVSPASSHTLPNRYRESIGSYQIVRRLGQGGQGAVYLAEDSRLRRRVALKVLNGIPGLSEKAAQRFHREAEITASLDHPGISTAYDFGETDGTAWIAMRYVEGESLAARLSSARKSAVTNTSEHLSFAADGSTGGASSRRDTEAPLEPTTRTREEITWVVGVIEQAAHALHAAHESGVIHRDIKPANIMVTPEGHAVILDFGLANAIGATGPTLTMSGDMMGTPQYIAPEQLTRDAIHLDRRADVYSLGITLYEALTLVRPFDSPTREQLYQAILAKDPPDPHLVNPAISRDLSAVVATAIEKDRDRRYQTALAFAQDLRRVLDRQPVHARRAGPLRRLVRWAERNPAVAGSLGALLLVLVTALIGTMSLLRTTNGALADKERALTDVERLSDIRRIQDLCEEARKLYPAHPSRVNAMADWIVRGRDVISRLPLHERALAALGEAEAEASLGHRRIEDVWKRDLLAQLVRELGSFADPDPRKGTFAEVEERLAYARTVRKRSVEDFADRWAAAARSIASTSECPQYHGLRVPPQLGLVPIGRNPATKLWEFVDLKSGALPETDGYTATFELEPETAVILVLLPGGSFQMGSAAHDAGEDEGIHRTTVPPFFFGKYEVSQAQWMRVQGQNPSVHRPEINEDVTVLHPVENVDWNEAADFARRIDLELPSETEWEFGCRAGADTAFTWGEDPSVLEGRANVGDASLVEVERGKASIIERAPWNDSFPHHAPVNALAANQFGIHGLHGNVGEWCRDWFLAVPFPAAEDMDQPTPPYPGAQRSWRDGCWLLPPSSARAFARHRHNPPTKSPSVGLRVSRRCQLSPP